MMVSYDGYTHKCPRQSGLIGEHRRPQIYATDKHTAFLRSSSLTQMLFKRGDAHTHSLSGSGKNRGAQPMFVMAVRATFPIFNSGTCSDAKNLLQCHSLPGRRGRARREEG